MVDRYNLAGAEEDEWMSKQDDGEYVLYSDYEALEAKLDALLIGLQVREIPDLKTKSPEHFAKIAECIADDSQENAAKIMHLETKLAALEKVSQRLVDHAQNADQELWASLPDVIALRDVIERTP